VPLPPEYAQLWGWLNPSQTWRNLGTTPRFDVTAPIAAQMWQAVTGQPVDGVLAVDPYGLQALLAAQGPVQTRSQQLDAANVVGYLLLNQYAGIPASVGDQADRLDQLSSVAQATVSALAERPWNSASLVSHLADVGKGRHVLAWSKDPVEERAWKAAGIAGELNPDSLAVSVMNFGGNKLDQFLKVNATLSVQPLAHGATGVHLDLKLHNTAPTGLPGYVSGPNPATPLQEGEYQGVLAVNVPGVGSFADLKGVAPVLVDGPDGPTKVVAGGYFQVPRGQTLDATVEFVLPAGEHSVEVDPSARIPATTWHFRHESVDDNTPRRFSW